VAPNDFSGVCIYRQPNPLLVAFGIDKGPEFIHLHVQLALGTTSAALGTASSQALA
jgi:hypothetical protein